MQLEATLVWIAVVAYAVASVVAWLGLVWKRSRWLAVVPWLLAGAVVLHAVPILLRWVRIGHGPYINAFEVLSSSVWVSMALCVVIVFRYEIARGAAGFVGGLSVLVMGWAMLFSPELQPLPPTFKGVWLIIHIAFAKLAYGAILGATGVAGLYLVRQRRVAGALDADAEQAGLRALDELAYRLVAFGFIAVNFMIAAGALWARNAWGRYWNWDPIETWALATWAAYGMFLHSRITFKVRGAISAWAIMALLVISIIAFFLVARVLPTVHTEFMVD